MKKILIIDDDADTLFMLKARFNREGYEVITTITCKDGLTIFYADIPDLVLVDINVGSEDGTEMCRSIKSQSKYQHIPVILFSANTEALKLYAEVSADAGIEKSFDLNKLVQIIGNYLKSAPSNEQT